ncbi:TIGR00288 family NYN domain-containing protein [Methanobacterium sp. SMA-27]|uniref:TIGR00288 family NYN domain-containing protein n=1 Tax=Methanobacterium sp. SMA-27 TaxID=1495336 RepID=UPI00064F49BF|nr:TIGR00288 family NYN domain-containing protein [Methanobacterium sp. SMA-27]
MHRLDKLTSVKNYIPLIRENSPGKNIGLLVDGPNMLRKEFGYNLDTVKDLLAEHGNVKIGKVFLNQYASDKLIEAVVNQGFSPMIVAGETDVQMAIDAYELIHNPNIDIIALMTRDVDFFPLINIAKEHGKKTIIIGAEPGFSVALKNSADISITMKKYQPPKNTT